MVNLVGDILPQEEKVFQVVLINLMTFYYTSAGLKSLMLV